VSIDRFQQALYWAQLARHYMPPGLLPRQDPGPKRLRMAGSTIRYPKQRDWPSFLLQLGQIDLTIGGDSPLKGAYQASVEGLTSEPALYGKPMLVRARSSAGGNLIAGIDVDAVVDHVHPDRVRDSVGARLRGVHLPNFDLPGLPFRLSPGIGSTNLNFALRGDRLSGSWAVGAPKAAWSLDSAGRKLNQLEGLVYRVLSGVRDLDLKATLGGTIPAPRLSISSNVDRAVAQRLEAVMGEELAKAERRVRAKVDSAVAAKVEPVKRQVAQVQSDARGRITAEQQRLDKVEADLQAQLKRLTGGLAPNIKLPKIKL
jgi:uncharacterized protein (TIGR03545 family)